MDSDPPIRVRRRRRNLRRLARYQYGVQLWVVVCNAFTCGVQLWVVVQLWVGVQLWVVVCNRFTCGVQLWVVVQLWVGVQKTFGKFLRFLIKILTFLIKIITFFDKNGNPETKKNIKIHTPKSQTYLNRYVFEEISPSSL